MSSILRGAGLVIALGVLSLAACKGHDNITGPGGSGSGGEQAPMSMDVITDNGGAGLVVRLYNSVVADPAEGPASKGWIRGGIDVTIPQGQWEEITWFAPDPANPLVGNFRLSTTWWNLGRSDFDWTATNANGISRSGDALVVEKTGHYESVRLKIVSN